MTAPHPGLPEASPDVAGELALEQAHVDRVYAELEKASRARPTSRPTGWRAAAPRARVTSATRR